MTISVGDVMTRTLVSVEPSETLSKCAKKLVNNGVSTLIVSANNHLIGVITSTDVLKLVTKHVDLSKVKAIDIATKKVAVIKPSSTINEALAKMREYNFKRLPVISKGVLVGLITLKDILKVDPSLYTELGELSTIKEEEYKLINKKNYGLAEGFCENCGAFSELIYVNEQALCPDCRNDMY